MKSAPLGWVGIIRLGLVQSAIGALFALTSLTLNRVMVVEYGLPAILPAAFVAWNYLVQISRPRWGHGSDLGHRRTPWIIGGMGVLALGTIMATDAATLMASSPLLGGLLAFIAYTLVGGGVGAAGTSLLALLATRVAPERRPAAASITWIMMIAGFIAYAAVSGAFLQPFSAQRLAMVASGVAGVAILVTLLAVRNAEVEGQDEVAGDPEAEPAASFKQVMAEIWADPLARGFTIFVFVSMLAYSAQELILEPFAGLVFKMNPAQSAQLSGMEKGGALLGMILFGVLGARFRGAADRETRGAWMRRWTVAGCLGSALALGGLVAASLVGPAWPIAPTVFALGLANGVFAVAAVGSMMGLAGTGANRRAGACMGVWGGAQAGAFAIGGFLGATGVETLRGALHQLAPAFIWVFAAEAALFLVAAILASRLTPASARMSNTPQAPTRAMGLRGAHT
jgi:BCD family chlorophyll transporter-like MFS transporter